MPLLPLILPPGFFANGTEYQTKGRWRRGDRVRFHNGTVRAIGGWDNHRDDAGVAVAALLDPLTEISRAMHSWRDNSGTPELVVGHNAGLWIVGPTGLTTDITPVGFVAAPMGVLIGTGYGDYYYGVGAYGTERPADTFDARVFNWCFRNWGEDLLAGSRGFGSTLYAWGIGDLTAAAVPNAPTDFDCFHVTQQRIVMTGGSLTEPRLVQWSDSEDRELWTPDLTNQAGSQRLPGTGRVQEIATVLDQILIVTETDAHVARYIGPPYIFGFDQVGDHCGAVSGAAVVTTQNFAVWPGARNFYIFDGTVKTLPCDVIDDIADDLLGPNRGTFTGWVNPQWREVWWHYERDDGSYAYVVWDYEENHWATGTLDRSVGHDNEIFETPMMMGVADGVLYDHEIEGITPGAASDIYVESGPLEIGAGDTIMHIHRLYPDFEQSGGANLEIIMRDRPSASDRTYGPYAIVYPDAADQPIATRARGRAMRLRATGSVSDFRLGHLRAEATPGGSR